MLVAEEAVEIRVLSKQGKSIRAIARMLAVSRNARYEREARRSKLDEYKQYIAERVRAAAPAWIPATVLLRELRALGYEGRHQHSEGSPGDAEASGQAGAADPVRDRTGAPDAGGLRDHSPREGSAGGVHRDARLEPRKLRRVRQRASLRFPRCQTDFPQRYLVLFVARAPDSSILASTPPTSWDSQSSR